MQMREGKKTFISRLHTEEGLVSSQQDKIKVAVEYFSKAVGTPMVRSRRLNCNALGYTPNKSRGPGHTIYGARTS